MAHATSMSGARIEPRGNGLRSGLAEPSMSSRSGLAEPSMSSRSGLAEPSMSSRFSKLTRQASRQVVRQVTRVRNALTTARMTRIITMTLALSAIALSMIALEMNGPDVLWPISTSNQMVYFEVEPGPQGEWQVACVPAKSIDGSCHDHLKRLPLVVYGALSTRPWKDHMYFHFDRAIVSSMSKLTSWMPHYELLRALTLGAFLGNPLLAVVFQPSTAFQSQHAFNATRFGEPDHVAAMAYAVINEVHGHVGLGDDAQKLWETNDPWWPYACYRYWRGGASVAPSDTWGERVCASFDFVRYLEYKDFVMTFSYFVASVILAMLLAAWLLILFVRVIYRWKMSQVRIMRRSHLFAATIREIEKIAAKTGRSVDDLLVSELPLVLFLECAVAKLDGDPYNMLGAKEGALVAITQVSYLIMIALPVHVFAIFLCRPNTPAHQSPAFTTAWSAPTYFLLLHYGIQGAYIFSHYLGGRMRARMRFSLCGRAAYSLYYVFTIACAQFSFFLIFWISLWLLSSFAVNAPYVLKLLSILGSVLSLKLVGLATADKFVVAVDAIHGRVERSVQSLTDDLETRAEHVDKRFKQIAAQLDMEGKSIFQMFVCFVLL